VNGREAGTRAGGRTGARTGYIRLASLVARRDFQRTVRRRGYVLGTLLLPLGVAALVAVSAAFAGPGRGDPASVTLVVVNDSRVPVTPVGAGSAGLELLSRAEAEARLEDGTISSYYVIPAMYPVEPTVTRVEGPRGGGVMALESRTLQERVLAMALQGAMLRAAGVPELEARQITQGIVVRSQDASGAPVSDVAVTASFLAPILFVTLFMISIFITSGYLLQSVTEEKENRVVEIVLSSVPSLPLMAGKILGLGAAGLTQVVFWLVSAIVGIALLGDRLGNVGELQPEPAVIVLAVVYFVLGYLAYGAIFAAIGALAPGSREAQQYSGFFGFLAAIPFVMMAGFMGDLQSPLVIGLALFPLTAPTAMLLVLGLSEEIPWLLVAGSLVSLITFTIVATWASGRIFRATVLLYGSRPSLHSILAAVRPSR
jgi:ABC-2 type transport system permease protein